MWDAHGFPYYYEPQSMTMSWDPPGNVMICDGIIKYSWYRIYPTPIGRCVRFVSQSNKNNNLCDKCAAKKIKEAER